MLLAKRVHVRMHFLNKSSAFFLLMLLITVQLLKVRGPQKFSPFNVQLDRCGVALQ
jgi:hypothetical protein